MLWNELCLSKNPMLKPYSPKGLDLEMGVYKKVIKVK